MSTFRWENPSTPCCGGTAAWLPFTYLAARLYLMARAAFILGAVNGCCWMQRDDTPIWPRDGR